MTVFDPFADDFDPESASHGEGTHDDCAAASLGRESTRKRTVDLDPVHRKVAKMSKRRIAGPKIVERDGDIQCSQLVQPTDNLLLITDMQGCFGYFYGNTAARKLAIIKIFLKRLNEVRS